MNTSVDTSMTNASSSYSYQFECEGDSTLIIRLNGSSSPPPDVQINTFAIHIAEYINTQLAQAATGIIEALPTFSTVGVYYDLSILGENAFDKVCQQLTPICERIIHAPPSENTNGTSTCSQRLIEIPICYEFGEDLSELSDTLQLSVDDLIRLHSNTPVRVFMLGFSPGLPYLGLFDKKLNVPRRATPRVKLPAGSVAIANRQCVIYPFETPGGWHIVGRTPLKLFSTERTPYTPYQPGDTIIFKPITRQQYDDLYAQEHQQQSLARDLSSETKA